MVHYSIVDYMCSGECLQNNDVIPLPADRLKATDVVVYRAIC